ncbi:MBL fold metallo-hydrolase [bacterium]|nr:MBL fold metallo-hydrolase [bacterium]MBU1677007.1 MBL fold metallo-hydrolase [bacterium]
MIINDLSCGDIVVQQLHLGGDRNFSYIFGDRTGGEAAIVDPGFGPDELAAAVSGTGLELAHILITHGHADHTGGVARLVELTGARVYALPVATGAPARSVAFPDRLGARSLVALETPGHASDHLCWLYEGFLATGDLLFCGKVGGTGPFFPGSSAAAEWASLHRILELPGDTVVLPGHDYYGGEGEMPHSTLAHERAHNPFLLCPDLEAFEQLKADWAAYKREHGIR